MVLGDHQRFRGYTVFPCKQHATELHQLEPNFRLKFLAEMSLVAEAVWYAFQPDKLNYELLGTGKGLHMHWHIFSMTRRGYAKSWASMAAWCRRLAQRS